MLTKQRFCVYGVTLIGIFLASCARTPTETPIPSPTRVPSPTVAPIARLIQAFGLQDPIARPDAVLAEMDDFLRESAAADDDALGEQIAGAAQVAQTMPIEPRAFVRRGGNLAIVGLPGNMGIYLFDLGRPDLAPVEVGEWTMGLAGIDVTWGEDTLGVTYHILGEDNRTRAHFSRMERLGGEWLVRWNSDETPLWWLCAHEAALNVSPDFDVIVLVGQAPGMTPVFDEYGNSPRRMFRLTWVWGEEGYAPSPPPDAFETRREWGWVVAEPSAYATLVEFMERLRMGGESEVLHLLAQPALGATAEALGLDRPNRRYTIVQADEETIIFRDRIGVTVATFAPGDPWLITDLHPYGAQP